MTPSTPQKPLSLTGRGGLTTRKVLAVLAACDTLAHQRSSDTFSLSVRELAIEAGIATATAQAKLKLLREAGVIRMERQGGRPDGEKGEELTETQAKEDRPAWVTGSEWRFIGGREGGSSSTHISQNTADIQEMNVPSAHPPSADLWRWAGLGASAWLVYSVLRLDQPMSRRQICRSAAVSRDTAKRALRRLAAVKLAEKRTEGWVRLVGSLDGAARVIGVAGRGERQAMWHAWERAVYRVSQVLLEKAKSDEPPVKLPAVIVEVIAADFRRRPPNRLRVLTQEVAFMARVPYEDAERAIAHLMSKKKLCAKNVNWEGLVQWLVARMPTVSEARAAITKSPK